MGDAWLDGQRMLLLRESDRRLPLGTLGSNKILSNDVLIGQMEKVKLEGRIYSPI